MKNSMLLKFIDQVLFLNMSTIDKLKTVEEFIQTIDILKRGLEERMSNLLRPRLVGAC